MAGADHRRTIPGHFQCTAKGLHHLLLLHFGPLAHAAPPMFPVDAVVIVAVGHWHSRFHLFFGVGEIVVQKKIH